MSRWFFTIFPVIALCLHLCAETNLFFLSKVNYVQLPDLEGEMCCT